MSKLIDVVEMCILFLLYFIHRVEVLFYLSTRLLVQLLEQIKL
jgi:hypothetical protein